MNIHLATRLGSTFALAVLLAQGLPAELKAQATETMGQSRSAPAAAREGHFTGSVSDWVNAGVRTELSGPAYLILTRLGRNHVVLCDEAQERPWTVSFSGSFPGAGEYPVRRGGSSWGQVYSGIRWLDGPRPRWDVRGTPIRAGTLTIEEAGGDVWVGSASASLEQRGNPPLEVSFSARVLDRERWGGAGATVCYQLKRQLQQGPT